MNTHDNDQPPKLPPPGILAVETLKAVEKTETKSATAAEQPASFPKVDPNYVEPLSLASMKEQAVKIAEHEHARDAQDVIVELQDLLKKSFARIASLETAILPFASQAMSLANMHMCLVGAGRTNEPSGGTWLNGINNASMQSNEIIFYRAADALGRARTEQHIMEVFAKVQEATAGAADLEKHLDSAALEGPIGGPISGRTH